MSPPPHPNPPQPTPPHPLTILHATTRNGDAKRRHCFNIFLSASPHEPDLVAQAGMLDGDYGLVADNLGPQLLLMASRKLHTISWRQSYGCYKIRFSLFSALKLLQDPHPALTTIPYVLCISFSCRSRTLG